jgi:HD-like signal output (HDOD) protein
MALLGLERVKALAVTVAMRGFLGNPNPLVHQCWRHSAACALVCEEIAYMFDFPANQAYTAGIMHDIGRLGFLKNYPQEMASVLSGEYVDTQDVLRAERVALSVDHTHAGSWLAGYWALPGEFADICEHHHDEASTGGSGLVQLVKAACNIADAIGFPAVRCQDQLSYLEATAPLRERLGRSAVPPEEDLRASVACRLAVLSR